MTTTPLNTVLIEQDKDKTIAPNGNDETSDEVLEKVMAASRDYHQQRENPFPVDAFPLELQTIIAHLHKQLGLPVDFIGGAMLGVASVAIGNKYALRVNDSWSATAILFLSLVGRPGTGKTPAIDLIAAPLKEKDSEHYHLYSEQLRAYRQSLDSTHKPTLNKYIVSDATPEALAAVHDSNKRGLLMLQDELAGLFKNFNRYHGGSEQENWLSIWSGQPVTIDRKTSDPIRITKPFISVLGGIQPAILSRMAGDDREHNGWLDRQLFIFPANAKKQVWRDTNPDTSHVIEQWANIINRLSGIDLLEDNYGNPQPRVLEYNPEAWERLKAWQSPNTKRINGEDEAMAGVLTKMEEYAVRFTLVLQMLSYASGDESISAIGINAVEGAIKLCAYFIRTADRVRNIINNVDPLAELPVNKKHLYSSLPCTFTTSEAVARGMEYGLSERTVKYMLGEKKLFKKIRHGNYEKA